MSDKLAKSKQDATRKNDVPEPHIPTVDVGIAAYNEQANIEGILESVLGQTQTSFKLGKIILISDGSSDDTVLIARQMHISNLHIQDDGKRKGKSQRLLEIFQLSQAPIVVLLDADILLDSKEAIGHAVEPISRHTATLTSGRTAKVRTGTWFDHVMDVSAYLQDCIKEGVGGGASLYACHGRIIALDKAIYKQISSPVPKTGNDAFLYLSNKMLGGTFAYASDAVVIYKAPQTVRDFLKQQRRFAGTTAEQQKIFGPQIIDEYKIPPVLQLKSLLQALLKYHIYTLMYVGLRIIALFKPRKAKGTWDVSASTKSVR